MRGACSASPSACLLPRTMAPLYRSAAKLQACRPYTPFASRSPPWHPGAMARETTEAWDQLATRIPKELHRRLKLYCVTHDIALMHFVTEALEKKLGRKARPKKGTA